MVVPSFTVIVLISILLPRFVAGPKGLRTFFLFLRHQYRSGFVFDEKNDKFRWFSLAGVPPNDVDIIRAFVEGLSRRQSHFLSASHLHHDRALQHINKPMCVVTMYGVRVARRILHQEHQTLLA